MASSSSRPSDKSDPWVILRTVPRVHAWDRDLSFELAAPPRLSFLTVSTRVFPARPGPIAPRGTRSVIRHPLIILTADLSASLFLTITPTPHPTASSSSAATATDDCYFVLDAAACTSHRVPDPVVRSGFVWFGVIAAPDGASFMVVGIRCLIGHDDTASLTLQCFSSRTGVWVTKDVNNPRPHRAWTFSDVIAHDGKLWWADTSTRSITKGLLYCNPFADQPRMSFVPLPSRVTAVEARAHATTQDYVQVAEGRLRWVHVLCDLDESIDDDAPCLNGAALLSIYTVIPRDDGGGYRLAIDLPAYWHSEFSFCFIPESDTFREARMPNKDVQAEFALMDPNETDHLYFFLDDYLFGFDIFKREVLGFAPHGMAHADVSSSSLLAWKLPPALAAAPGLAGGQAPNNTNGGAN